MSDTEEQMKGQCQRLADRLEAFAEGKLYDSEEGEMVSQSEIDWDAEDFQEDRYLSLYDYLMDNYGIKIKTDIQGDTMYSCEICLAWGGPGIYIDTGTGAVEGYWWGDRATVYLSEEACRMIDETVDEMRDLYR